MNKKRLSVVMAGAMLASSVAPVLAAEVVKSEASAAELGLLIQKVRNMVTGNKFANETVEDKTINGILAGTSIYEVEINGIPTGLTEKSTQANYQDKLGTLKVGDKVTIKSKGHVEKEGKFYGRTESHAVYTSVNELNAIKTTLTTTGSGAGQKLSDVVNTAVVEGDTLTVTFKSGVKVPTLKLTLGDETIDTSKYLNWDNVPVPVSTVASKVAVGDFAGFPKTGTMTFVDIKPFTVEDIVITPGGQNLAIEDLYDGLMLTTKGHDFFTMLKEADAMGRGYTINGNAGKITDTGKTSADRIDDAGKVAGAISKDTKGNYVFKVTFPAFKLDDTTGDDVKIIPEETYTITSKDEKNAERLANWMLKPLARVDILAGDNRYETAAKIAREYAGLTGLGEIKKDTVNNANIVLVNGEALVDGLAAAPLAATKTNNRISAPILLTEADELPKATKAYLKELLAQTDIGALKKVTIHLVGGESVLSKSLERELFHLGFDVKRYGGDNREETSLEVAEAIEDTKAKGKARERFVVGADGEADAMSIAAVAAYNKTPIVVAKRGGISEDALHTFDENANVAIVGGESVVSAVEENGLKSVSKSVIRLAGSNRKATNAKVISTYYKRTPVTGQGGFVGTTIGNGNTNHVLVAKDGQKNKSELIDALAAANFASEIKAPIVLATDKLSEEQVNALELNTKQSTALYQIGHGVARDVVKTIAEGLDLTNNNRY